MFFDTYKKMLMSLHPTKLKAQLKEEGDVGLGLKYLILGSIIFALAAFLTLAPSMTTSILPFGIGATFVWLFYILLVMIVSVPVLLVGLGVISLSLAYKVARLLGGKGKLKDHFYHLAMISGALAITGALFSMVPFLGIVLLLVQWLYSFYLGFIVYRELHKLGTAAALLMGVFPLAVIGIVFLLMLVMSATLPAPVVGEMGETPYL